MAIRVTVLLIVLALIFTPDAVFALEPPPPGTPPPTEQIADPPEPLTPIEVSAGGTIGLLKYLPDGAQVKVSGKVVTGVFTQGSETVFYLEEADRSAGIRIIPQVSISLSVGDLADVAGQLTTVNGERAIVSAAISPCSLTSQIDPLLIALAHIGGGPAGYQTGVTLRVPVTGDPIGLQAVGINNVGLLVNIYGRVTAVMNDSTWSGTYFYVDDGSDVYVNTDPSDTDSVDDNIGCDVWDGTTHDCSGATHKNLGVRVGAVPSGGNPSVPVSEGDFVGVVGIVGTRVDGQGRVLPLLKPRMTSDITLNPTTTTVSSGDYDPGRACQETGETSVWSMVSLPLPVAPIGGQYPPADDVIFGEGYPWVWSSSNQSSILLDSERTITQDVNNLVHGVGYWFRLRGSEDISYTAVDDDATDRWVSLPGTELNLFGHPFDHDVLWRDLVVTDGKAALPIENASSESYAWMYPEGYWWTCDLQGLNTIDISSDYGATTNMESWRSYYAFTNKPVALIVPGSTLPASSRGAISVVVTDDYSSQPIAGARVYCKYGSALTGSNGVAEVGVQQPNSIYQLPPGTYLVTASAVGFQSKSAVVTVTASTLASVSIQLYGQPGIVVDTVVSPASVPADGVSVSDVSVYVTDEEGAPWSGKTVTLSTTLGGFDDFPIPLMTDSDGLVRATLKSSTIGTATITGTCDSTQDQATVEFTTPTGPQVALPTFAPGEGTYCDYDIESVTISCATQDAGIYYTIDLEEPTQQSIPYDSQGCVVIPEGLTSLTLRARAFKAGCLPSDMAEAEYTIIPSANCPGPEDPYRYIMTEWQNAPAVSCIGVTDIRPGVTELRPGRVKIEWSGNGTETFELIRSESGQNDVAVISPTSQTQWVDSTCPLESGATYTYKVRRLSGEANANRTNLEPKPPEVPENDPRVYKYHPWNLGAWAEIPVTIVEVPTWQNQTVDSRVDVRCADNRPMNYKFGDLTYRGGLFVGSAADHSKTARSFLQFNLVNHLPPSDKAVLAGSVNAYCTGVLQPVNWPPTVVMSHLVTNDSWNQDTLDWTSSLTLLPEDLGTVGFTESIDSSTPRWCTWPMYVDIVKQSRGDRVLSVGLASTEEMQNDQWAYFAKSQYGADLQPVVLYAYGLPVPALELSISPNPMKSGRVATGTVTLAHEAPAGGVEIDIGVYTRTFQFPDWIYAVTTLALAPESILIPEGQTTGTFPISTYPVDSGEIWVRVFSCPRMLEQSLTLLHH